MRGSRKVECKAFIHPSNVYITWLVAYNGEKKVFLVLTLPSACHPQLLNVAHLVSLRLKQRCWESQGLYKFYLKCSFVRWVSQVFFLIYISQSSYSFTSGWQGAYPVSLPSDIQSWYSLTGILWILVQNRKNKWHIIPRLQKCLHRHAIGHFCWHVLGQIKHMVTPNF